MCLCSVMLLAYLPSPMKAQPYNKADFRVYQWWYDVQEGGVDSAQPSSHLSQRLATGTPPGPQIQL